LAAIDLDLRGDFIAELRKIRAGSCLGTSHPRIDRAAHEQTGRASECFKIRGHCAGAIAIAVKPDAIAERREDRMIPCCANARRKPFGGVSASPVKGTGIIDPCIKTDSVIT
jgi:hypothetical protein